MNYDTHSDQGGMYVGHITTIIITVIRDQLVLVDYMCIWRRDEWISILHHDPIPLQLQVLSIFLERIIGCVMTLFLFVNRVVASSLVCNIWLTIVYFLF